MPEVYGEIAEQIKGADPSATMRIGRITAVESAGAMRVQTDATGDAWVPRSAETTLSPGDSVWLLQQRSAWLVGGRLGGGGGVPIGVVNPYAGTQAPHGWLMCDGSAVSRLVYPVLFAALGTTYGNGDGASTFNVPNLLGRFPLGQGAGHDRGATGGAAMVTLSAAQLPSHDHGEVGHHQHYAGYGASTVTVQSGSGALVSSAVGGNTANAGGHAHALVGSGQAHENMPPFVAMAYIIRAL